MRLFAIGAALGCALVAIFSCYSSGPFPTTGEEHIVASIPESHGEQYRGLSGYERRLRFEPGIAQPLAIPAGGASVPEEAEVIGIKVNGRPRAYLLATMADVDKHVVNDVIDGVPVSVSYCNLTSYVRCFTAASKGPLELNVGGLIGGQLHFQIDDELHAHDSVDLPYDDFPFQRTTWGEWRKAHPQTDIFVG